MSFKEKVKQFEDKHPVINRIAIIGAAYIAGVAVFGGMLLFAIFN